MSRLDELIKELCPDGVEYKRLGDVAIDMFRGNGIKRDEITEEGISCVRYGEIYTTYGIHFDKCFSHTKLENIKSPKYFEYGDILFAITGENIEDIAKSTAYVGHEKCLAGGDIVVMKHKQNPKYISYALGTREARIQKQAGKVKSKVVHASIPSLKDISIPVPPMPIQEEIVRILDKFTSLTAELKAELKARKKQYEYYRDALLSFDEDKEKTEKLNRLIKELCPDGVEFKRLGDVAKIERGKRVVKEQLSKSEGYPVYQNCLTEMGYYKDYNYNEHSTFIIGAGAAGDIGYSNIKFWAADDCFPIIGKNILNNRYIFHILMNQKVHIYSKVRKASIPRISRESIGSLSIPVPPMPIQEEIVKILDRFDTLCNDLSAGLPAEIEKRQKQYEYFRDRLLTFKPKK